MSGQSTSPSLPHPDSPAPSESEAVFWIAADGVVQFATPAVTLYYGYQAHEVIGRPVTDFVDPADVRRVQAWWNRFVRDTATESAEIVVTVITAGDGRVPVRGTVWRLPGDNGFLLVHHVIDRLRDRLATLYAILTALSGTLDLDQVMSIVLTESQRLVACDTSTISILDSAGTLRVVRAQGHASENHRSLMYEHLHEFETTRTIRENGVPLIINDCGADPRWKTLPDQREIGSWLGAPLIHRGEFLGSLDLDSARKNAFAQEDAELVQALATQVAAAVYNARQFEDETRRAERFRALSEVSQAISRLDLDGVLEVVYQMVNKLMDTSTFYIGLYDVEAGLVRLVGAYDYGERSDDDVQKADVGLIGQVLHTCQSVIINDVAQEGFPDGTIIDGEMPRSLLMMPLITQDEVVGVISLQSYKPHAYTPDDIAMLETIAGTVATAIQNAQLYDETVTQLAALEALHGMGLKLASVQTPDTVAELTIQAVLELFSPGQVRLYLSSQAPWQPRLWIGTSTVHPDQPRIRAVDEPALDTLMNRVRHSDQPAVIHDLSKHPALQAELDTPWLVQAAAVYPIMRGGEQLGVLALLHSEPHFFRQKMLRTLELFCMQAATALETARYYDSLRGRLNEVSALQDLARHVSSSQTLDDISNIVVNTMRDVYQCKSASIALLDPAQQLVITHAAAGLEPQYIQEGRFKLGEPVAGKVVATGEAIYVPDTQAEEGFRFVDPDVRSLMAVPLMAHDQVIGSLSIDSTLPNAFTPDHERVLMIAGGQIAAAIETVRLLQETRDRATELEQVDALRDELLQNVSHELRSPLALVRGYAGLMRDHELGPITPDQEEALSIIDQKAESITRLISDILTLEMIRPDTLELGIVDLNEFCARAVEGARLVFQERGLIFEIDLATGTFVIEADRDRLDQVFDNLIGNAAKFSPDGSTIHVRTVHDEANHTITVSIRDHGIGIPADKQTQIFERFFQVDRSIKHRFGGAGLGLSIVRQIVLAHHGRIWVESEEGQGSTFFFSLPLIER